MAVPPLSVPHWSRVVGQWRLRAQLAEGLRAGRGAHAYLFSGPAGVGKGAVALAYAALLMCDGEAPEPCGTCPQCAATKRLEHPDLHLVFPLPSIAKRSGGDGGAPGSGSSTDDDPQLAMAERVTALVAQMAQDPYTPTVLPRLKRKKDEEKAKSELQAIRIEQIRSLIRWASLKPYMGRRKVFVIFGADTMNTAAQNALLKALEEPAAEAYFLLVAESETALLPTIRSRCQRLRLAPLSREEIQTALALDGVPAERAEMAAALCGGRLQRARELAGSDLSALQTRVIDFLRAAAKCDPALVLKASASLMETGELAEETALELLGLFLRDVAVKRAAGDSRDLTFATFEKSIAGVLAAFPTADLETAAQAVDESAAYLAKGYTQDLVLWALAIRLHAALGPQASTKPKPQTAHNA